MFKALACPITPLLPLDLGQVIFLPHLLNLVNELQQDVSPSKVIAALAVTDARSDLNSTRTAENNEFYNQFAINQ